MQLKTLIKQAIKAANQEPAAEEPKEEAKAEEPAAEEPKEEKK